MSALSAAQLAIYAVLAVPVLFITFKHGRPGLLGWIYLFAFCSLRVVGGAMDLSGSSAAAIISNIGLSPLVLATSGILHEARDYLGADKNKKIGWLLVLLFKLLVLAALGLLAAGGSSLQSADAKPSDFTLVKVGIAIMFVSWVMLCAWTVQTMMQAGRRQVDASSLRTGRLLTWGILAALPFIGIRIIYTLVAMVTRDANLSPSSGSIVIRTFLAFLPELISTFIYISVGLGTRDARQNSKRRTVAVEGSHIQLKQVVRTA